MIEILMCTYNGEKFIQKQLKSLFVQTKQADLVRIFDDMSTDDTVKIITEFIQENKLDNWILTINDTQKGWRRNFYDAINCSTGDIIFFCDQDDIWKEDKIEIMSKALIDNNLLRLSGLQYIIDENDQRKDMFSIVNSKGNFTMSIKKEKLTDNLEGLRWKSRIGCAMVISKELVDMIKFFEFDKIFAHDVWAVEVSSALGRGGVIDYPCISYRVHGNNATAQDDKKIGKLFNLFKEASVRSVESFDYIYKGILESDANDAIIKRINKVN
jgi:glycosyltransferase involved in cell wall biosynthesis